MSQHGEGVPQEMQCAFVSASWWLSLGGPVADFGYKSDMLVTTPTNSVTP